MRPYWKAGCSAIYAQEWVTIICHSREFYSDGDGVSYLAIGSKLICSKRAGMQRGIMDDRYVCSSRVASEKERRRSQSMSFNLRLAGFVRFCFGAIAFLTLGTFPTTSLLAQPAAQNPGVSPIFRTQAGKHYTRAGEIPSSAEVGPSYSPGSEDLPVVTMAPTRSTFLATWDKVSGAKGYRIVSAGEVVAVVWQPAA